MLSNVSENDQGIGAGAPPPPSGGREGIACSQVNLHHCVAAVQVCNEWMGKKQAGPRIAFVQEPYILENEVKGFNNIFNVFYVGNKPRACIITSKNLNVHMLSHLCNRDQTVISVKLENSTIIMASVYMPWNFVTPVTDLMKELVNYCEADKLKLIICSDTNCHNVIWGSTNNNARGEFLLDYILGKDLFVCNIGTKPTFETIIRKEVLDVTFATGNLINRITNWHVSDEYNFSDHKTIEFNINFKALVVDTEYRNVRKTNWTMYREEVRRKRDELLADKGNDNLDSLAIKLEEVIVSAFHKSCRISQGKKFNKPPWWTAELTTSKKKVIRLKRRLDRLTTEERIADFRKARNDHSKLAKKEKGKSWEKLCNEVEKLDTVSRIQRIFKIGKKQEIGSVRKENGEYTVNTEDTLKVLLDKHFPDKELADEEEPLEYQGNLTNDEINNIIHLEAIKSALKGFKPFKAPGLDGIYPILIQKAFDIIENDILYIYRMCLKEGKSPARWLETKVAFIPKGGKKDYTDPGSLRPICLSPFFSKGLEKVIYWHINDKHLKNDPCKNLFAYKEGTSTDDAIHALTTRIERALDRGEVAIVLFMDMSAAFSTANTNGMMKSLESTGVNNNILQWTNDMLQNRNIIASLNGTQVQKRATRGTPQGGILSGPILWNGVMKDLVTHYKSRGTYRGIFADDIFIIGTGICEFTVAKNIQDDIKLMEKWASSHSLRFNVSKTKLMFFTRRRNYTKPDIFLYGEKIEYVSEMKYLGVLIDDKLSWLPHIKKTAQKATYTLMQCKKMVGKSWGLKPRINRWIYQTLVRPVLTYGCLVWIRSTNITSHMNHVEKVQRRANVSTLNALHTTPSDGMEVMLNMEPIHIFIQAQALNTYRRLLMNGNWLPKEGEIYEKPEKLHSVFVKGLARDVHLIH